MCPSPADFFKSFGDERVPSIMIKGVFGLTFGFGFCPLKANQRAGSKKQLFLKADFLVVQI
jgi:hypothetical protein